MENFIACSPAQNELLLSAEFDSMAHFKWKLFDCLDYCNNRRIKSKFSGLPPAIHKQQALSAT